MNAVDNRQSTKAFANSMVNLLDRVEYRRVRSAEDFSAVEQLRRSSYKSRDFIDPSRFGSFLDDSDRCPDCYVTAVYIDEVLTSTVRLHIVSEGKLHGPTAQYFPESAIRLSKGGRTYVDPSRFATDPQMLWQYPALPFLTLRVAVMACEYFSAEYCMSCVRADVASFYRRTFGAVDLEPPTPIDGFTVPLTLLGARESDVREKMENRYPFFRSMPSEQKMLFAPESELTYPPLTVLPTARLANSVLIQ